MKAVPHPGSMEHMLYALALPATDVFSSPRMQEPEGETALDPVWGPTPPEREVSLPCQEEFVRARLCGM